MSDSPILWEETVEPGATWSHVFKRGTALRITDIEGGANVGALFYNFECPDERYNMPDTLKAQHIARLTKASSCTPIWVAFSARSRKTPSAGTIRSAACSNARAGRDEIRQGELSGVPQ